MTSTASKLKPVRSLSATSEAGLNSALIEYIRSARMPALPDFVKPSKLAGVSIMLKSLFVRSTLLKSFDFKKVSCAKLIAPCSPSKIRVNLSIEPTPLRIS